MKVLKIIGLILLLLVIVSASGVFYLSRGLEEGVNVVINPVNLSEIKDGVYNGRNDFGRWTNELNVTVANNKITNIEIVKDVKIASPELSTKLFQNVIEEQNIDVDVVSGGTVTSKAYLKSIENALNN
ncbi:MAG: FMN-binding protein [Sedimentibacter saalensis]|uniref:FMN-binding protein n=1 Tax=Sedimentibacter saalensis TaxID=130788 RepID=A0A562JEY9_9FIRM|nr:FMN-binding protein [Sedimentibacter saalensis]MEA5096693.1 FMN-binding protein [Sedimentibacter saalensis]TWH81623.1 FMN-binding protein [Sedimentibacter saalensis]